MYVFITDLCIQNILNDLIKAAPNYRLELTAAHRNALGPAAQAERYAVITFGKYR